MMAVYKNMNRMVSICCMKKETQTLLFCSFIADLTTEILSEMQNDRKIIKMEVATPS